MMRYRNGLQLAALAAGLMVGLLAAEQARAFTIENKDAGNGSQFDEKAITSSRYGTGKATTLQRDGFSLEIKQYGSSGNSSPSDERNVNDLAPRYNGPQPLFR